MADISVQWDERAAKLLLERSPQMRALLEDMGQRGVAYGERHAPDAPPLRQGYIDSFEYSIGHTRDGLPALVIANTDWKAIFIERGTAPHSTNTAGTGRPVSMPAHHIFDHMLDDLRR